jgi:SAM-dependent methyltransferase
MEIEWEKEILYKDLVKWESRLKREAPFFKELLDSIDSKDPRILDVSCGTGYHLSMFAKWGYKGVGIDISELNIEHAKLLAQKTSVSDKLEFVLGDILELEKHFPEEKFDFIFCIGNTLSIFDISKRKQIISQMLNLLNKNGLILIQIVNYLSHKDEDQWFYKPNLKRTSEGVLLFHLRIMEWKDTNKEKVRMFVQRLKQNENNLEDFEQSQKTTEFFAIRKEDFHVFNGFPNLTLKFLGDFNYSSFCEETSNDLILIIEKKKED